MSSEIIRFSNEGCSFLHLSQWIIVYFKIGMDFELSDLQVEEEVMMELEGYYEEEMQGDLLDRLVAEHPMSMSGSSNYSYRPAPFSAMDIEEDQNLGGMGMSGSNSLFSGST